MSLYLGTRKRNLQSANLEDKKNNKLQGIFDGHIALEQQGIFNKLLRPPSQTNIKPLNNNKKYEQKFKKPDVESLIHEINTLKLERISDKKVIMNLKLKNQQNQRKVKKMQNVSSQFVKAMDKQGKNSSVYAQILKKKIHDLNLKYLSAESQIKQLKKLPNISIYEQNNIEKEYLISQTIRLKSIISSLQEVQQVKFQDQFLKMLKQQNQKLKATIRLLQNDKVLLKSKQTIQTKLTNDLKKQIQHLKQKILHKQAQIQKLNNQNKNLLFKKANQFRLEQQKKQNEQILKMNKQIEQLKQQRRKIMDQHILLTEDNNILKSKQKLKVIEIADMQQKYENQIKNYLQQNQQLQFELANIKNDYLNLLNNDSFKKKKSKADPINNNETYLKPVRFQDIELSLFVIHHIYQEDIQKIFIEEKQLKCSDIINIFEQQPFSLVFKEAQKLARYLVEDNTKQKILYNPNAKIDTKLAITILKSSIRKLLESISDTVEDHWKCVAQRGKRLIKALQSFDEKFMSKKKLIEIISRNTRNQIQQHQIHYLIFKAFNRQHTTNQIMLETNIICKLFNNFVNPQTKIKNP